MGGRSKSVSRQRHEKKKKRGADQGRLVERQRNTQMEIFDGNLDAQKAMFDSSRGHSGAQEDSRAGRN